MYSRTFISALLAELASDMPRMLRNRNTFFREFTERAEQIRGVTAPEDEARVLEVLEGLVAAFGVNDQLAA